MNECVVFIHGLGRRKQAMAKIERYFASNGYETINFGYSSLSLDIKEICAGYLSPLILDLIKKYVKIHFVTHSLGGIILRVLLNENKFGPAVGRAVMLAPPNNGSDLARYLSRFKLLNYVIGPNLKLLSTGENNITAKLPLPDFEFGVITGSKSVNPIFSMIIGRASDGKVAVDEAKLSNMKDFKIVKRSHTFIMNAPEVMEMSLNFIKYGYFEKFQP
ncbi:MAG: alpha/beta hydrolase [Candidatus Wallbacteria bacterium]